MWHGYLDLEIKEKLTRILYLKKIFPDILCLETLNKKAHISTKLINIGNIAVHCSADL